MKDIYVLYSDIDSHEDLRDHKDFIPYYEYSIFEHSKTNQYEYGKINTDGLSIHFIYEMGLNKACPWCDCGFVKVKTIDDTNDTIIPQVKLYAECQKCLARGSLETIYGYHILNPDCRKEAEDMVLQKWALRHKKQIKKEES